MQEKLNLWTFVSSIICIILFLLVSFSGWFGTSVMGVHPLAPILIITLLTFLFSVFGLSGIKDLKGLARGTSTILLTISLSVLLSYILLIGKLFS
ncbi:hypothetical protein [Lentibacillus kimchii]|uniref:Uncharacterized protein n=1 Tax=Lentibacillus kimchii TaxID=1542911 RepID=A0ABW2UWA7_9BACI